MTPREERRYGPVIAIAILLLSAVCGAVWLVWEKVVAR